MSLHSHLPTRDDSAARRGSLLRLLPSRLIAGLGLGGSISALALTSPWVFSEIAGKDSVCVPSGASSLDAFSFLESTWASCSGFTASLVTFRGRPRFLFGGGSSPVLLAEAPVTTVAGTFFLVFPIYALPIEIANTPIPLVGSNLQLLKPKALK